MPRASGVRTPRSPARANKLTMAWIVPPALEVAVRDATRAAVGDAALVQATLIRSIVDRSQRYTSDRARLSAPTDRTADLAARAAFFTIADAMKIAVPIGELVARGAMPARRPLRVVDVGAGCGAMTLGLIAALATAPGTSDVALEVIATDRDVAALGIAAAAVKAFAFAAGVPTTFLTRPDDVVRGAVPPADLVLVGTVLNELPAELARGVVDRALAALSDDGAVIIVEPALRDTSRALHALRDAVIAGGRAHVFAPCTRRTAPCPALADVDDWCHEDRALTLPPRTAELSRATGLRDSGMKFSYLVLRKGPLDLVAAGPAAWRLVSAARIAKGKHEIVGCSERGRMTLRLLRRHRTGANRELERADRGDVVVIGDATTDAERIEVTATSTVERPAR